MPIAMLLVIAITIQFPLQERISSSKHIQLMAGVSPSLYWFTIFLYDLLIYFFLIGIMVLTIVLYDRGENFTSPELSRYTYLLISKLFISLLDIVDVVVVVVSRCADTSTNSLRPFWLLVWIFCQFIFQHTIRVFEFLILIQYLNR